MTARGLIAAALVVGTLVEVPNTACAASSTILRLEASVDGRTWLDSVRLPAEGGRVILRASVSFVTSDDVPLPLGFAGLTWQPTISNWNEPADRVLPWSTHGTNTTGGSVPDVSGMDGPFGRVIPFATSGPTSSDPYRGHVNLVRGTPYLRLARSSITNWVGDGATAGTNAFNNFNGSGGLNSGQKSWANVTASDPRFVADTRDCLIFKLGVEIAPGGGRSLWFDAPQEGMSRNSVTGRREAAWYAGQTDNFGQIKGLVVVVPANIIVVPGPGAACFMTVSAGVLLRRARRATVMDNAVRAHLHLAR